MQDIKTAWENRFGSPFYGPSIPFGAEITYKPISPKDLQRLHQFGTKELRGIFIGYAQQSGGRWSKDLFVVDIEELEKANKANDVILNDSSRPKSMWYRKMVPFDFRSQLVRLNNLDQKSNHYVLTKLKRK